MRRRVCIAVLASSLTFGGSAAAAATTESGESVPLPPAKPETASAPPERRPAVEAVPVPRAKPGNGAVVLARSTAAAPVPPEKPDGEAAGPAAVPEPPVKPALPEKPERAAESRPESGPESGSESDTPAGGVPVPGTKPDRLAAETAGAPASEVAGPPVPGTKPGAADDLPVPDAKPPAPDDPESASGTAAEDASGPEEPVVPTGPPQGPPVFGEDAMSPACAAIEEGRVSGRPLKPKEDLDGHCLVPEVYAISSVGTDRAIGLTPEAELNCAMVARVDDFVETVIEPAAREILGSDVVELGIAGSYVCRPRNGQAGATQSEHGKANAIDIARFVIADGRTITVTDDWSGETEEAEFLRRVHDRACGPFTTVIGPDGDAHHRDHFHFDLQKRGADGQTTFCQ